MIDPTHQEIQRSLAFDAQSLRKVEVLPLEPDRFSSIQERIFSGFCYDNALVTAAKLEMHSIVYGAATVSCGSGCIHVEHAWVKDHCGRYFDPTYQLIEINKKTQVKTQYYSLLEFTLDEYLDLALATLGTELHKLTAIDFYRLRMNPRFAKEFRRT